MTTDAWQGRRHRIRVTLAGLAVLVAGVVWTLRVPLFARNFGVVEPGQVYRSAQPDGELGAWIEVRGIKSILNLRGGAPTDRFYREELRTANEHGVLFYDIPLSATRRPCRRELLAVAEVLEKAPYPLLIHCKQGADRTGLATSMYYMLRRNEGPVEAERGFSLEHAHLPMFGPERLHEPLDEYADWLKAEGAPHTPERFREWVAWVYRDGDPVGPLAKSPRPGPRPLSPRRRAQLQAERTEAEAELRK